MCKYIKGAAAVRSSESNAVISSFLNAGLDRRAGSVTFSRVEVSPRVLPERASRRPSGDS